MSHVPVETEPSVPFGSSGFYLLFQFAVILQDSPQDPHSTTMSHMANQLLQAVKSTDPQTMASTLSELRSDLHLAQRPGLNAEITEIISLLEGAVSGDGGQQKVQNEIDDEEKFLYGDSEESKPQPEPVRHHSLDLYGNVTEDSLYSEPSSQRAPLTQLYGCLPPPATSYLEATPTVSEVDKYVSGPTASSNHNIVQVSNPIHPPEMESLEENEHQTNEEYEQIQDLLKTIGLDLGVTEISKMAARTKERLQGKKPPPKTPTRRQRYSSDSSDSSRYSRGKRRSHSSSSSSSSSSSRSCSREPSGKMGGNWSSDDDESKKNMAPPKKQDTNEATSKRIDAPPLQPQTTDPASVTPHTGMPIPTYPPSQVHSMMPPTFPPPAYGQYSNYMPYMHQQWPPMYPPPSMALPPPTTGSDLPSAPPYKQPYENRSLEVGVKGEPPGPRKKPDHKKMAVTRQKRKHDTAKNFA